MKSKQILFYIFLSLSILINAFIIVEGALAANESANQSFGLTQMFIDFVKSFAPDSPIVTNPDVTHAVIRKLVGHFGLFGVSGVFTTLTFVFANDALEKRKKDIIICSLISGLIIAFISETLQLFAPGRAFAITDVLIDYAGYILFGGIAFLISLLIYRKKRKE